MPKEKIVAMLSEYIGKVRALPVKRQDMKGMAKQAKTLWKLTTKLRAELKKEKSTYKELNLIDKNLRYFLLDLIHFEAINKKRFITDEELAKVDSSMRETLKYLIQSIGEIREEFYPLGDNLQLVRTYFDDRFIRRNTNLLALIASCTQKQTGIAYFQLNVLKERLEGEGYKIEVHTKSLIEISEAAEENTPKAYEALASLPAAIVNKYMTTLSKIAKATGKNYVASAFKNLPVETKAGFSLGL